MKQHDVNDSPTMSIKNGGNNDELILDEPSTLLVVASLIFCMIKLENLTHQYRCRLQG